MLRRAMTTLLLCGAVLSLPLAAPARAQDDTTREDIALQNQILELRHDLDTLRAQQAAGGAAPQPAYTPEQQAPASAAGAPPSGDMVAQLLDRVSRLEDQTRSLQGALDEANNKIQQQNADFTKQLGDMNFRVQTLEGGKGGTPPPGGGDLSAAPPADADPAPVRAPAAPPVVKAGSLQQGYAALARRDYPSAEASARAALKSPRAYDAQFLLAQALAGQHNYQPAALAYDDAYTKQRKGSHAQDALIGLADTLSALGDKPAACATLDKLHAEFTSLRPDVRLSAASLAKRARCH